MPPEAKAFVVPCADLSLGAPARWLALGWRDYWRAPGLSLSFGLAIMLLSIAISAFAWYLGRFALLAALLSGFVFIAPLIGVGMYCICREIERGHRPTLWASFRLAHRVVGQAGVFALAQLVILMIWSRSGMILSAFFPVTQTDFRLLVEFLTIGSLRLDRW